LLNENGVVRSMLHSNGTDTSHDMNHNVANFNSNNNKNAPIINHQRINMTAKDTADSTKEGRNIKDSVQFKSGSSSNGKILLNHVNQQRRGGFSISYHGNNNSNPSFSLPPELKKILFEVAKTGKCNSLPWTASEINSFNAKRTQEYHRAAKRKKQKYNKDNTMKKNDRLNKRDAAVTAGAITATTATTSNTTASIVKWESNSNIDDSSVKSSNFKLDTTSSRKTDDQMNHPSSVAPSHADSSSVVETASLASQSSKRSADISITVTAQNDFRRRRFFRDQSYASSCSESVSSTGGGSTWSVPSSSASMGPLSLSLPFRTLRGALRLAVALVLEYSYKHRGGYKLSPAEMRRFEVLANSNSKVSPLIAGKSTSALSYHPSRTDIAFMERRMRLLKMLGGGKSAHTPTTRFTNGMHSGNASDGGFISDASIDASLKRKHANEEYVQTSSFGPPFTIQRVAEVLLAPERYYIQTHKLCNALEKLLLVTLPSSAFGGGTGGDTFQNRREEQEIAALADKKEKDESEQQIRKHNLKRRKSSCSYDSGDPIIEMNVSVETSQNKNQMNTNGKPSNATSDQSRRSTTRQSSGPPLSVSTYQPAGGIGQKEGDFNTRSSDSNSSPAAAAAAAANQDTDVVQRDLQVANPLSNTLYQPSSQGLNPLMNNHALEIVIGQGGTATTSSGDVPYLDQMDVGRFSASNSDIDSESDDISFDDSASDRSDGSDFESTIAVGLTEPFTAARVMALNRVQQQHRREQYLQDRASRQVSAPGTTSNFQSIADFEYQSGDSIDSNMAEDSCGSDSSSQGDFTD
jgi:hypothetical protein